MPDWLNLLCTVLFKPIRRRSSFLILYTWSAIVFLFFLCFWLSATHNNPLLCSACKSFCWKPECLSVNLLIECAAYYNARVRVANKCLPCKWNIMRSHSQVWLSYEFWTMLIWLEHYFFTFRIVCHPVFICLQLPCVIGGTLQFCAWTQTAQTVLLL